MSHQRVEVGLRSVVVHVLPLIPLSRLDHDVGEVCAQLLPYLPIGQGLFGQDFKRGVRVAELLKLLGVVGSGIVGPIVPHPPVGDLMAQATARAIRILSFELVTSK